jgi:hypothetical protein
MTDPRPTHPDDGRVSRRGFLGAAGSAGAALAVAACGGSRPSSVTTSHATTREAAHVTPPPFHSRPDLRPPRILVARRPADPGQEAFVFTDTHGGRGQQGPMIIDRAGRLKWFLPVSHDGSAHRRVMNVRVQSYRGKPVLTFWIGGLLGAHGVGHYEIYDTSYRQIARVQAGVGLKGDLHEFVLTPQGTALLTAYGEAKGKIPNPDGQGTRTASYFYCCCQEVDVATGKLLLNWRSDQHVPFSASRRLPTPENPATPWDYFHMNSINVDPSDGNLVVSSRNLWQVYKIERHTGRTLWRMGGAGSDFEVDRRAHFAFQHHITPHADGIYTIFDNEAGPPDIAKQSRGLVIKVDEKRRKVHFVREYHHDPKVLSDALGSVQPLAAGHMFIGWGESSWFTEWDARGDVLLDARLAGGVISYRAFQDAWSATPAEPPKFVAVHAHGGTTLYVSWNGATVHHRWQVLGGASTGSLARLTTAGVDGFETAIALSRVPDWLIVEALDDQGAVVGRSDALRVRR